MNKKELLAGATFVTLYTGFIWTGFGWMLSSKTEPIKKNQARLESEITLIKAETTLIKENQARLETRMDRMEERIGLEMQEIKSMLGQILIAQNIHHKGKSASKFKKPSKAKPAQRKTANH